MAKKKEDDIKSRLVVVERIPIECSLTSDFLSRNVYCVSISCFLYIPRSVKTLPSVATNFIGVLM